jgi:hypothetical protein
MTVVGKILVFVNLVFALAAGALMMIVYATRTNHEEVAKRKDAHLQAATAALAQKSDELQQTQDTLGGEVRKWQVAAESAQKELKAARELVTQKDAEIAKLQSQGKADTLAVKASTTSSSGRRDQVAALTKSLEQAQEEKEKLIAQANEERGKRINADVEAKTLRHQNQMLDQEIKNLQIALARAKTGGGTGTGSDRAVRRRTEENPPKQDVTARVTSADPGGELIKISAGSDSGLAEGHTLMMYRLGNGAGGERYLGKVQVVRVSAREAVVKPFNGARLKDQPQPGDLVASRLY